MNKKLLEDSIGWGFLLWLFGYILGIVFFMFVPPSMLGWAIMPFGIGITLFVLIKKIGKKPMSHYLLLGVVWTLIAIVCDYFFLVKLLKPVDGYYKLDVYLYYIITFALPLLVGLGGDRIWGNAKK